MRGSGRPVSGSSRREPPMRVVRLTRPSLPAPARPIRAASLPSGYAYVGDLKQIELYTAGGINVMTGWIDDQFVKNSLTILGETESEGNVFNAPLLVKADVTA